MLGLTHQWSRKLSPVNYQPPDAIGFGIARGSASFLVVGKEILDYSGKLLNLAARLNELARPKGIVIDGNYQEDIIPEALKPKFKKQSVFLRGIAENDSTVIFYSEDISLPQEALFPLNEHSWGLQSEKLTVDQVLKLDGDFSVRIPEPISRSKVKAEFGWPSNIPGRITTFKVSGIQMNNDAGGFAVSFPLAEAKSRIGDYKLEPNQDFYFRVHFVPKPPQQLQKRSRPLKKVS